MCVCVCVCLVLYNNICILPVRFALLTLSIIVFVLFPSFPFAVMGLLLKANSCRARQFMSGVPWAEISVQIRQTSKELVVQRGAQQRPQGRSKTACTSPPPPKSVLVDFKNACAPNSSATTQHNMRSIRRPIFGATVRISPGSAATSSPDKPHLTP